VASPPGRTYPRLPTMAVVSVPDHHRSEQVAGFARPTLGYTATYEELIAYCGALAAPRLRATGCSPTPPGDATYRSNS
jgi:hypothetical protein